MGAIRNPALLYMKAGLFLVVGILCCWLLWLDRPTTRTAMLLVLAIWSFARCYYFVFYVIEHYIDPGYRFSGLLDFMRYALKRDVAGKKESPRR